VEECETRLAGPDLKKLQEIVEENLPAPPAEPQEEEQE
jgi:hypothetical protein